MLLISTRALRAFFTTALAKKSALHLQYFQLLAVWRFGVAFSSQCTHEAPYSPIELFRIVANRWAQKQTRDANRHDHQPNRSA
jgi:hypothetical protein